MPVEFGLELLAMISADGMDSEREPLDHMIYEGYGVGLGVALVDFKGPNTGGIVHGGVLETSNRLAAGSF